MQQGNTFIRVNLLLNLRTANTYFINPADRTKNNFTMTSKLKVLLLGEIEQ